ncbi:MAG TPA: class I SAM-dependent methyltransferase [Fontimonas sp.]
MDEPDLEARALAWSRYWRSGARHSCPGSFVDHYGAATQRFWTLCFARIRTSEGLLELGCGNGSLIRFLAQVGEPWPQRIDAVDLAELEQGWLDGQPPALRSRIRLHPRTPATRLPIADHSVHRVYSQYALEYFASDACWSEIGRTLAPGAELAAVVHHRGSHLVRLAQSESQDSQWLLAEQGPLDRAAELLPWLAMSADAGARARREADPQAAAARQQFNAAFARVSARIEAAEFPDLLRDAAERVMKILQAAPVSGAASARSALDALRAELVDNRLRVAELVDCALDGQGIEAWIERLRSLAFSRFEVAEIVEQGYLFGWSLVASRGSRE